MEIHFIKVSAFGTIKIINTDHIIMFEKHNEGTKITLSSTLNGIPLEVYCSETFEQVKESLNIRR